MVRYNHIYGNSWGKMLWVEIECFLYIKMMCVLTLIVGLSGCVKTPQHDIARLMSDYYELQDIVDLEEISPEDMVASMEVKPPVDINTDIEKKIYIGSPFAFVTIRQILVPTWEEADFIRIRILSGADFQDMAKTYSHCRYRKQGGLCPSRMKEDIPLELHEEIACAPLDVLQGPIETESGYYLFEVIERS